MKDKAASGNRVFEYAKSVTLSPLGYTYRRVSKGNRRLRILPECRDTKSLFIHIPKTGGHSVGMALYKRDPFHFRFVDYADYALQHGIDLNDYFKFSVVRHPVDRLISMYNYLHGLRYVNRAIVPLKLASNILEFTNLWLELRAKANGKRSVPFLYSQRDYVCNSLGSVAVDYVAKLEDISSDFKYIASQVGYPEAKLMHVNRSKSRVGVDSEDREILTDLLAEDVSFFNY